MLKLIPMKNFIWLITLSLSSYGQIKYVKPVAAGSGDGSSWANASSDLQAMINVSGAHQVWVAAGTYKPTSGSDRSKAFVIYNGVSLYGGFLGTETQLSQRNYQTNETIFSGNIGNAADSTDNSKNLFSCNVAGFTEPDSNTVIDGFILEHAYNDNTSYPANLGGAIKLGNGNGIKVVNCTFRNNYAYYGGGAIGSEGGIKVIRNCIVFNNKSDRGSAFYTSNGMFKIDHSEIYNNHGGFNGAVRISNGSLMVTHSAFHNNDSENFGGAIVLYDHSMATLSNTTFTENSSDNGAALMADVNSVINLTQCDLNDNNGTSRGGAIYLFRESAAHIAYSNFNRNYCDQGGCLNAQNSMITLDHCEFNQNEAGYEGGAIYTYWNQSCDITQCTFDQNTSGSGGAIAINKLSPLTISQSTFTQNAATDWGGAIEVRDSSTFLGDHLLFSNNDAYGGGSIDLDDSDISLHFCRFITNTAEGGAALYAYQGRGIIAQSVFDSNNAIQLGGASCFVGGSNMMLENNVYFNNTSDLGGACWVFGSSDIVEKNSTYQKNTATTKGNAVYLSNNGNYTASNSIFWNTSIGGSEIEQDTAAFTVKYSLVKNGHISCISCPGSDGNLDPLFESATDADGNDNQYYTSDDGLKLQSSSPAKNAGSTVDSPSNDFLGLTRDSQPDIGAYEYGAGVPCPEAISFYSGTISSSVKANQYITNIVGEHLLVGGNDTVIFQAGNYIQLNPGFSTGTNAVFITKLMGGCQ